jgi:hypothetical protein
MISNATPLFENDFNIKKPQKTLKSNLEHFLHFVGPKILAQCLSSLECETLISGATSRYTTFTLLVARRYHRKFAAAATITDQA